MTINFRKTDSREPDGEPLHYTACGLDDVYLVNGFTRETIDGEEYITIEDMDGLWKAIGMHVITNKKTLAPQEIRFLRNHLKKTQAELASDMRVSDQTVARWEKGQAEISGPADFLLRILFLACPCAQPEGAEIIAKIKEIIEDVIQRDEPQPERIVFQHRRRRWTERRFEPAIACM